MDCFYENCNSVDCTEFSLAACLCHWSIISGVHLSLDAASGHWRKSSNDRVWKPERNAIDSFQKNIFELSRVSEPLLGSQAVLLSQHILKILALYQKQSVGAFLNCWRLGLKEDILFLEIVDFYF